MTISTIIIIIIALFVLAAVLFAFTRTESNFRDTISSFFSSSNVDIVKDQCNRLADSDSNYEYCCVKKEIKLSKKEKFEMTCLEARNESWGNEINLIECENVC